MPSPGSDQAETHTEPLCALSPSLPRFARLGSAAKARNCRWRHPRREFIAILVMSPGSDAPGALAGAGKR